MVKVMRPFCWHQTFDPKAFSALVPGLYTCMKSLKMFMESDFEELILKLAAYGQREKAFLLSSKFVSKGLSAPALGLYTCIKALKYIPGPGVRWVFTGPLVLWLWRTEENFPKLSPNTHLIWLVVKKKKLEQCHQYVLVEQSAKHICSNFDRAEKQIRWVFDDNLERVFHIIFMLWVLIKIT